MALEESVQQSIMLAIQQLEHLTTKDTRSMFSLYSEADARILRLTKDLDAANESKDALAQHCHHLEQQIRSLLDEKSALFSENQVLASQLQEKENIGYTFNSDTRKQMELLKEKLFKVETLKDDYSAKIIDQEKQINSLQEKIIELQFEVETVNRLKDEVDALTETADKVKTLEITLSSYKKKMEDYADVKKQLKTLEDKNIEYLQSNLACEEELKKCNLWKTQLEIYKENVSDLQQKLDEHVQKLDKANYLYRTYESKYETAMAEKKRLVHECHALHEENEELKVKHFSVDSKTAMSQELMPTEMKERVRFLEKENLSLRNNIQDSVSKQTIHDDALNRIKKLSEKNRILNQKILELETQLEENVKQSQDSQITSNIKEYEQKIELLQGAITLKDNELQMLHSRYARNIEKARDIAMNLEIKSNGSIEPVPLNNMKELEAKMITTAFYKLGSSCCKETIDERLALFSAGQGQSFLSRQRQPTPRKMLTPFKSK